MSSRKERWKDRLPSNLKEDLEERRKFMTEINKEYFRLQNELLKSRIRVNNSMAELNEQRAEFNKKFGENFNDQLFEEFREYLKEKKERREQTTTHYTS